MSVINLFLAARNAIADRRRRQRAYAELVALDDRSLADIGVHRSQIASIVDNAACAARDAKQAGRRTQDGTRQPLVAGSRGLVGPAR